MNVRGVDFLVTFRCPSGCTHCSYQAGFHRTGFMHVSHATAWLRTLKEQHAVECVTIHGGEPFLYPDIVKHVVTEARMLGIPRTWVITNGYWASDDRSTEMKLQELKKAGLACITVSVDAFHQEYVPVDRVTRAVRYSLMLGFDIVAVDSYFLGSEKDDNHFNIETERILQDMQRFTGIQFSRYPLRLEGRAAGVLSSHLKPRHEIPSGRCPFPFWIGGDFMNPETIEIDPAGNITLCPGLSIGNARDESLRTVLDRYDPRAHPVIAVLHQQGPVGLYKLAMQKGYDGVQSFVDECHLCYEMRKFLRPKYRRFLVPSECYTGQ